MKKFIIILLVTSVANLAYAQKTMLTLEECENQVLANSADVKNASLDVRSAQLQKQEALAEYFPSISAGAYSFHALKPLIQIQGTDVLGTSQAALAVLDIAKWLGIQTEYNGLNYGFSGGVSFTQPIYAGGRIVNGNKLAELGKKAANTKSDLERRKAIEDVRKNFYFLVSLQEKQATVNTIRGMLDTLTRDVEAAVAAGLVVKADLTSIELKRTELDAGENKLNMGLRLAKMNLLNSMAMEYNAYPGIQSEKISIDDFEFLGSTDDLMTPEQAYVDEAVVTSTLSETQLLEMQVEAKKLMKKMTVGEALPTIGLGGQYNYSQMVTFSPQWNGSLFAVVKIPITDWGKNSKKIQRQSIEIQKAENQQEYFTRQLTLQLRQLFMQLTCDYDNLKTAQKGEELSLLRLQQLRAGYKAGLNSIGEVMMGETDYRNAQQARIDAANEYVTALGAYRLRTGK